MAATRSLTHPENRYSIWTAMCKITCFGGRGVERQSPVSLQSDEQTETYKAAL